MTQPEWMARIPKAAQDYIKDIRLDEVECIVADIAGVARGKAMPASKFARQDKFYLPNSIFLPDPGFLDRLGGALDGGLYRSGDP